jgi:hypothetical protein
MRRGKRHQELVAPKLVADQARVTWVKRLWALLRHDQIELAGSQARKCGLGLLVDELADERRMPGRRWCRSFPCPVPASYPRRRWCSPWPYSASPVWARLRVPAGRLRPALARPLASRLVNGLVGVLLMALATGLAVAR